MPDALIMTEEHIQNYLSIKDVLNIVEKTYLWYSNNEVVMPAKITTDMAIFGISSWINAMPSYIRPLDTLGIKWAGGFSKNRELGFPYIMAYVLLNDPQTGLLKALVEGNWLSDIRTGAQTAVASKYLAQNPKIVAIIGAGAQGIASAKCILELFLLEEIRVFDINMVACENFARDLEKNSATSIMISNSIEAACRDADIIITVTNADESLVKEKWVKPGAFVSAKGSYQELDEKLVFQSKLYVDHIGQNLHRGEFLKYFQDGRLNKDSIVGEIGDVISGKVPGRESGEERIVASLIGMGCLDVAIATIGYEKVIKEGVADFRKVKLTYAIPAN